MIHNLYAFSCCKIRDFDDISYFIGSPNGSEKNRKSEEQEKE